MCDSKGSLNENGTEWQLDCMVHAWVSHMVNHLFLESCNQGEINQKYKVWKDILKYGLQWIILCPYPSIFFENDLNQIEEYE